MSQNQKFEQVVKIVNEFSEIGESRGLGKLYTQDEVLNGRLIRVNNKTLINMGSCSYLGLELDPRLKEAAIDAVNRYGTYFSCSRIFVSCGNYLELEEKLSELYGENILLTTNSSLGHQSVMPILIRGNDMVIYDQQAHISMHEMSYKLNHFGSSVTVLRHNRLDELEQKIELYKHKYDKIWYVIDGVYSMFGDLAPIKELVKLLDKHKKLHLYIDDAHGMSWAGPNGSGFTLSQTKLHPKMIMGTSMAKGFGSCGGIFLFKDKASRDKVRGWGGPLAYSGPQEPATIAAAIASAKIHLSGEIYELQNQLQDKIKFCVEIFKKYKIPLVSESISPIFFVACGLPRVGFNLVERMISEGFYTNIGIFPAVPETCTGVRFTLNNHLTFEDIEKLAKAFAKHHPLALAEEGRTLKDIHVAFRKFTDFESRFGAPEMVNPEIVKNNNKEELVLKFSTTIKDFDKEIWDNLLADRGAFDYESLILLEEAFSNNQEPENNWKFFYYMIFENEKPILATFFTSSLYKDDMLASSNISEEIEKVRINNPYYLTSTVLMMGSQLTNGNHLYIDRNSSKWEEALSILFSKVQSHYESDELNSLIFRDFEDIDVDLRMFFINHGFVKIEVPENNVVDIKNMSSIEEFFKNKLHSKQRSRILKDVVSNVSHFCVSNGKLDADELAIAYDLYSNVHSSNYSLSTFKLPFKLFQLFNNNKNYEIIKVTFDNKLVGIVLCGVNDQTYSPILLGMNYEFMEYNIYKVILLFVLQRAIELKKETVYFGITANETKRKFGAEQIKQVAYVQMKDKYNQDLIDSMSYK